MERQLEDRIIRARDYFLTIEPDQGRRSVFRRHWTHLMTLVCHFRAIGSLGLYAMIATSLQLP